MQESISIKIKEENNNVLDFNYLKQIGIQKIQQLSGKIWTDYNIHDPGITILEILCYAVTELGYRTQYAVKDLLAKKNPDKIIKNTLFTPTEILPSQPITINDYRKLLLDIEGVKNAFIYPSNKISDFRGIYDVDIETFPGYDDVLNQSILRQEINLVLNMNRNLCEDFNQINFIENDPISLILDIEISTEENLSELLKKIYLQIFEYFSPTINFYSLEDVINKGLTTDQIFEGPLLKSGFIIDNELNNMKLKNELYASDIIHFLMDINNVKTVKRILFVDSEGNENKWICTIKNGKSPVFDYKNSKIRLFNFEKEITEIDFEISEIEKIIKKESNRSIHKRLEFKQEDGVYKNLSDYYSIQNDFPEVYGIGNLGLPPHETNLRKAQAKQLKAYLLFFEQIITNFFAQLDNLNLLFSIENIDYTFFSQPLKNVPGIEFLYQPFINKCLEKNIDINDTKLLKIEWKQYLNEKFVEIEDFIQNIVENREVFYKRRNSILDHLLARLGYEFLDYKYNTNNDANIEESQIEAKLRILNNYQEITKNRGKAFKNIFADLEDETNISGFEFLLNNLLNLKSNSKLFPFGFIKNNYSSELKEKSENDIIFYNDDKNSAFKKIFFYASEKSNFVITKIEENRYKLFLKNDANENIAEFSKIFDNLVQTEQFINDYSQNINILSDKSESVHIFERIFLRPIPQIDYFRFAIILNSEIIFNFLEYQNLEQRKKTINQILIKGTDIKNYEAFLETDKQYRIKLFYQDDKYIKSRKYFPSLEVVNEEVLEYSEYFKKILNNEIQQVEYLRFFTKHYDIHNMNSDPYSFIITILLPDWSKRFQNERFQKHIENIIRKETPAHIFPDIKWVSIEEMKSFYIAVNQYQNLIRKRKPELDKIISICDILFKYLV